MNFIDLVPALRRYIWQAAQLKHLGPISLGQLSYEDGASEFQMSRQDVDDANAHEAARNFDLEQFQIDATWDDWQRLATTCRCHLDDPETIFLAMGDYLRPVEATDLST